MGLVLGLLFCAVIIAGLGTHAARSSAEEMKTLHLPFMETALSLERLVYETVFHVGMFGSSGDMASYSGARVLFPSVRSTADTLSSQALSIPDGQIFARDMEVLRNLAGQLDMVVEKKRTLNDELAVKQEKLRKLAGDMGEILLDLQARVASAKGGNNEDTTLNEKARLLVLNGFSLTVAEVTGRVLAAGVAQSAEKLVKAQTNFSIRWEEAREACVPAAILPSPEGSNAARVSVGPAEDMVRLVALYGEILDTIRFNLEESARVAQDRIAISGRLTVLTRGLVAAVRSSISAAADRTDIALRGAAVTLFACALLACVLGIGAVLLRYRTQEGAPPRKE